MTHTTFRPARQSGMSLVELMVGMLIGLIGIIIITHLYLTNEQYKRSTTASGASQVNGTIALFALERDLRMAGFGLNHTSAFNCNCDFVSNPGCSAIQYYYDGRYSMPPNATMTNARNALALFPVVITAFPDQPDVLSIFYGGDNERVLATKVTETMVNPADPIKVDGTAGFENGNLLVMVNTTVSPHVCALTQVTLVDKVSSRLEHDVNTTWNPPGSILPAFPVDSLVFNLGTPPPAGTVTAPGAPVWRTYGISNGRLQSTDQIFALGGGTSQDVMNGIVDLQAQYGKDTSNDGAVDVWEKTFPVTGADWNQVLAVRIALLVRSEEYVKPSTPGGACEATTTANKPTWAGGTFPTIEAAGALPSCYRYRVFETVVPLRNMIWRFE
jgi:type IV pilus assembly protein PilW